jgi:predicted DNA-binding protein (UPF0251 family)
LYLKDPDFNRTKAADLIGVSRRTILRAVDKLKEK